MDVPDKQNQRAWLAVFVSARLPHRGGTSHYASATLSLTQGAECQRDYTLYPALMRA